jgi:hypothetical protein
MRFYRSLQIGRRRQEDILKETSKLAAGYIEVL